MNKLKRYNSILFNEKNIPFIEGNKDINPKEEIIKRKL